VSLDAVRSAIDSCGESDTRSFARRTRNAIALAVVSRGAAAPPAHPPPVDVLEYELGPELAELLAGVYAGGPDWTSSAIDALEPLHELVRS
jgi:hypothetical protein